LLPSSDYERVRRHLKSRQLRAREIVQKQDEPMHDVYFFSRGACSLVKVLRDGQTAEIASIGREGAVGAWAFFGDQRHLGDAIVHAGDAVVETMPVAAFRDEMERREAFFNVMIRYSQALTAQLMQTTVCNGIHSAEERCSRWLLTTQDRLESDEFPMTHEFVAAMLGVRRPTVTLVLRDLMRRGIISYRRARVTVIDRAALEITSCECYEQIRGTFRRLLPEVHS
jgi:CRP-like cAMP-binding protein